MTSQRISAIAMAAMVLITMLVSTATAGDKVSFKGKVKSMDLAANTVVVTEEDSDQDIVLIVEKSSILKKFEQGKIDVNDKVRGKYITEGEKNIAQDIRKPGGC